MVKKWQTKFDSKLSFADWCRKEYKIALDFLRFYIHIHYTLITLIFLSITASLTPFGRVRMQNSSSFPWKNINDSHQFCLDEKSRIIQHRWSSTKMTRIVIPSSFLCFIVQVFALTSSLSISTYSKLSCAKELSDGCSAPSLFRSNKYVKIFEPACIRHDVCYECVSIFSFYALSQLFLKSSFQATSCSALD